MALNLNKNLKLYYSIKEALVGGASGYTQESVPATIKYLSQRLWWESITEERIRSNLSKTKNIPPKALIFSDFCCTFAMSLMILLVLICSTKVSEKSDMAKS